MLGRRAQRSRGRRRILHRLECLHPQSSRVQAGLARIPLLQQHARLRRRRAGRHGRRLGTVGRRLARRVTAGRHVRMPPRPDARRVERVEARRHEDRPGTLKERVVAHRAVSAPVNVGENVCAALNQIVHAALTVPFLGARAHRTEESRFLPVDQTTRALQRHEGGLRWIGWRQLDLKPRLHVPAGSLSAHPWLQQAAD
eukprot:scaffold5920_cov114-Isochrysis_galbana.AAC.3